jgi:hypothetical protein
LGLRAWTSFAVDAGVRDVQAFNDCSRLPVDAFPRIGAGLDLGRRTGVRGTPTVWVNGNRIGRSDAEALRAWIAAGGVADR